MIVRKRVGDAFAHGFSSERLTVERGKNILLRQATCDC